MTDILDPAELMRVEAELAKIDEDEARTLDVKVQTRGGDARVYELTAGAFKVAPGVPAGHFALGRDVTSLRQRQALLALKIEELDDFAQTVSHDLKRPLSAIMLASETLRRILSAPYSPGVERPAEAVNEMARIITDECKMASSMISSMLKLAETAQVSETVEEVDLSDVVASILEEISPAMKERQAGVCIDPGLGCLKADRAHVYGLFANLIGNAVQHASGDALVIEVRSLPADDGYRKFLVRDNGDGIPDDKLSCIFRPFYRGEGDGTGIGLTTARKVVKLYGGEIRAYNDGGACFEFTLKA
jgi:two-component system, LuxR family, sensor kinase FixL